MPSYAVQNEIYRKDLLEAEIVFSLPADSSFFLGHFPETPIFAGAFQLQIAKEIAEKLLEKKLQITRISKAKFTAIIGPDEPVTLSIKLTPAPDRHFKIALKLKKETESAMTANIIALEI